jgi:NitT/TauT family transport system substrate-binding protein
MKSRFAITLALASVAGLLASPAVSQVQQIKLGTVQSFGAIVTYIAKEKGYYREAGIEVDISFMNSAANVVALLAKNELQVVEGGISVGYFNGLEQGLPIIMTTDRVSTPIHHQLLVRAELKDKITKLTDLRGKNVGSNSVGAVTTYELGKMLATVGMTLKDIELKTLAFPQMAAALRNGALDATLQIPPFAAAIENQGIGVSIASVDALVQPTPMTIAASFINTDWAAKNKELVRNFFVAYMRATRDYCIAYHNGPNRKEVVEIALKNGLERTIEAIEKNPWTGRSMDGSVHMESVMDQQKWYVQQGLVKKEIPTERVVTREYIEFANAKLGPPPAVNPDSKLPGCR